jgi:hypothetical protein
LQKNAFLEKDNFKLNTIYDLFKIVEFGIKKAGFKIKSYPINETGGFISSPYDINKWMSSMKNIYTLSSQGLPFKQAFEETTNNWDKIERNDFEKWISYYQQGNHMKYKTAQDYYQLNGDGPPLIPMNHLSAKLPGVSVPGMPQMDMFNAQDKIDKELKELEEKKKKEEAEFKKSELRKKIISRLQAAEKIVTDPSIQQDLNGAIDMGLGKWLETLHSLKRSIQTAPMRSSASCILQDLIFKESNRLKADGFSKAGVYLDKIAQEAAPFAAPEEPEGLEESSEDDAMNEFVLRMNNNFVEEEDLEADDDLYSKAQIVPPIEPEIDLNLEEPAEIEVEEKRSGEVEPSDLLEHVTLQDIVTKLESVADILRKRELPRQIALVDLMMNEVGISGFFPTLAEAHRSALDSNGYMSSRIDDIISKLRGSLEITDPIQLTTTPQEKAETSETLESVRHNLERSEDAEKARQENRKAKRQAEEMAELEEQEAVKELAQPVSVQQPPRMIP